MNRINIIIFRTVMLGVFAIAMLFIAGPSAFADDDHGCTPGHEHIGSCGGTDGQDGQDGRDGRDGIDGADGRDGIDGTNGTDGRDGIDGIDGRDGIDGVVNYTELTRVIRESYIDHLAATTAIQIHLPQDSSQRFTLSGSTVGGTTGIGAGYAYKFDRDDNLAVTAGVGSAGGEQVGVVSVGFEFGARTPVGYDDSKLERRLDTLEKDFQRQQELWNEDAKRCASELDKEKGRSGNVERKLMECLRK